MSVDECPKYLKKASIYELDWTALENQEKDLRGLPDRCDKLVKGFRFALTPHYLQAVRHFANLGLQERNRSWGFDTMIRDNIQIVNGAAIETSFMLLADCLYDEETKYWVSHDKWRVFTKPLMIYKYWAFQTGRGIVRGKSSIDKTIENTLTGSWSSIFTKAIAKDLSESLNELENKWEEHYVPLADVCGEATGPSIEPDKHEELNREIKKVKESYKYLVEFFGTDHSDALELKEKYDFL